MRVALVLRGEESHFSASGRMERSEMRRLAEGWPAHRKLSDRLASSGGVLDGGSKACWGGAMTEREKNGRRSGCAVLGDESQILQKSWSDRQNLQKPYDRRSQQRKRMGFYQFNLYPQDTRADLVWEQGRFLAIRTEMGCSVVLYHMSGFFV